VINRSPWIGEVKSKDGASVRHPSGKKEKKPEAPRGVKGEKKSTMSLPRAHYVPYKDFLGAGDGKKLFSAAHRPGGAALRLNGADFHFISNKEEGWGGEKNGEDQRRKCYSREVREDCQRGVHGNPTSQGVRRAFSLS